MLAEKLLSGRFVITVVLTFTMAYMLINSIEVPVWFVGPYTTDIILYFFRSDRTTKID